MNRRHFISLATGLTAASIATRLSTAVEFPIPVAELNLLKVSLADDPKNLIAPGAKLEKLWAEGEFTEGAAEGPDGCIYFSDIGNELMKFDPKSKKVSEYRNPSGRSNGIIFDSKGRMIVAEGANTGGQRRVTATDMKTGKFEVLADNYNGKKFNSPNDVAIDTNGRIFFSDPRYVSNEPRELDYEAVFRIDPNGKVTRLETGAFKPNGVVVSPDGKTLYVADNGSRRRVLLACKLDKNGDTSPGKSIYDFGDGRGTDGMTITTDGRIVATAGKDDQSGVWVFSPDGKLEGVIRTPEAATNCEFGGPEAKTLYICAGVSLYRIETNMKGFRF
ncbi:MAG: SMP-30/gluconolactonase/LRE family protein [Planctomycetota bacterium]